jgi:hypothetical protein
LRLACAVAPDPAARSAGRLQAKTAAYAVVALFSPRRSIARGEYGGKPAFSMPAARGDFRLGLRDQSGKLLGYPSGGFVGGDGAARRSHRRAMQPF